MKIESLKLYQFRSYESLNFFPHEKMTVLLGENAQGKTNILEAIYLCATGKSHRGAKDAQLIKWGCDAAYIGLDLEKRKQKRRIEMRLLKDKGKQLRIDGASVTRIGELMGCLNAVFFSPEDLRLVKDGPSERRRFMDIELSQMYPAYFYDLSAYLRSVSQRNALLKQLQVGRGSEDQLLPWEDQIALYGSKVYIRRKELLEDLSPLAQELHHKLSGEREKLILRYDSELKASSQDEAKQALLDLMLAQRQEDIKKGLTKRGLHKDDIELRLDGMDLRAYASQGQQRSAALALKLSELQWMTEKTGEKPVFLLDDVLSELDESRQNMLLEAALPYQTLITSTHWDKQGFADVYRVQNSIIQKLN